MSAEQLFRKYIDGPCSRSGDELYFKCIDPDHRDRKPSMSVNLVTGVYNCMGCDEGGFADYLLSRLAGVKITEARAMLKGAGGAVRNRAGSVMQEKKFSGRFVPLQTKRIINYLTGRGISARALETLDLREGAITDAVWRDRAIWAYRNKNGKLVQVEGRNTDGNRLRNPYHKDGKNVSGFVGTELLRDMNGCRKPVLVVEGALDMMSLRSVGYKRSLAIGGSAFGKERAAALKAWTDCPVLLFDAPKRGSREQREKVHREARAVLRPHFKSFEVLCLPGDDVDPNRLLLDGTLAGELKGLGLVKRRFV